MKTYITKIFWSALFFAVLWGGSAYAALHCPAQRTDSGCGGAPIPYETGLQAMVSCAAADDTPCCIHCTCAVDAVITAAAPNTGGHYQWFFPGFALPMPHPENGKQYHSRFPSARRHPTGRWISILNQSLIC